MTIQEALRAYPDLEADLLLAHVLKTDKEYLYMNNKEVIPKALLAKFQKLCSKLKEGWPTAYLLEYKYFCGLKFKVNEHTLIPRPESEWLVEQAVKYVRAQKTHPVHKTWRVLDMGTGSGCLIISLAKQLEGLPLDFVAVDISAQALSVAKKNANFHNVKMDFKKSDLFSRVNDAFDIIFANLPYVPHKAYKKLAESLKHEPASAITTNDETWEIYEKFIKQARTHLTEKSLILFEIDPKQKPVLELVIKKWMPDAKFEFARDIHGLWRYAVVTA